MNIQFRNHRGQLIEAPAVSATDAKNAFGHVLDTALSRGVVAITKRDRLSAVVMSIEEYQALVDARRVPLDALSAEFDALLDGMQTPKSRKAMKAAFDATPAEMGRAAVAAARRRKRG